MKMNYDVFKRTMLHVVQTRSPEYYPELVSVPKMNGVVLWGIQMQVTMDIRRIVYLEDFYKEFKMGKDLSSLMDAVWWECLKATKIEDEGMKKDAFSGMRSFETAKDRLFIRTCSAKLNKKMLEKLPYLPILDLAFFAYYQMDEGIIKVTSNHVKAWGVNPYDVIKKAIDNTVKQGLYWCNIRDIVYNGPVKAFTGELPKQEKMLFFTNQAKCYGASTFFLENFAERVGRALGGSYYILPSSIHEVVVVPASGLKGDDRSLVARYLMETVQCGNMTMVEPEEVLSDSVYFYDVDEKKINIVEVQK